MTPDDFKFQLLDHARALRHSALERSKTNDLDPATSQWVVTYAAWRDFKTSKDFLNAVIVIEPGKMKLLGLPVRITVDDDPLTPPVQLVMEPMRMWRP